MSPWWDVSVWHTRRVEMEACESTSSFLAGTPRFTPKEFHYICMTMDARMKTPQIRFTTKAESKKESLEEDLRRRPEERFELFLKMSAFYQNLYPTKKQEKDNNFHIFRHE